MSALLSLGVLFQPHPRPYPRQVLGQQSRSSGLSAVSLTPTLSLQSPRTSQVKLGSELLERTGVGASGTETQRHRRRKGLLTVQTPLGQPRWSSPCLQQGHRCTNGAGQALAAQFFFLAQPGTSVTPNPSALPLSPLPVRLPSPVAKSCGVDSGLTTAGPESRSQSSRDTHFSWSSTPGSWGR